MRGIVFRDKHKSWLLGQLHLQNLVAQSAHKDGLKPDRVIVDELVNTKPKEANMGTMKELAFFPDLSSYLTGEQIELAKLQWLQSIKECREKPTPDRCIKILDVLKRAAVPIGKNFKSVSVEGELTRRELVKEFKELLQKCRKGA